MLARSLGTGGDEPEWGDRRKSEGHIGIPLASADFIDQIPMMSRLLKQLGVSLDWIERGDTAIVGKSMGSMGGCFYVRDAATEIDAHGRKIITAQDFVERRHVKTVFGVGAGFMGSPVYLVTIAFCREELGPEHAERFMSHLGRMKVTTADLVKRERYFIESH